MRRFALAAVSLFALTACQSGPSHLEIQAPHGPNCAAIQTASRINFSDDRADSLGRIAASPNLTEHEQIYLIDAALENAGFSSDTADVLVTLASNPALTEAARIHLAQRLDHADLFSADLKRIADALAANPPAGS